MDETYWNGELIGKMTGPGFWNVPRAYSISKDLLKAGENVLSVRIIDTGGGGGFYGNATQLKIYPAGNGTEGLSIAGDWHFLPIAEFSGGNFYLYGGTLAAYKSRPEVNFPFNSHTPTGLYNGMIAPLIPYTLKGAIWYQGESNANRAKQYETLFPKMIESWRAKWGLGDFPFYFTQIAPFNYGNPDATESAQLRDAQRKTLQVVNTGMAVTLDIGNAENIHPGNKQDVGKRLAFWALAKDYGKLDAAFSGPLFNEMTVEGNQAKISFYYANNGLKNEGETLTGFEIAGEDGQFLDALAKIEGNKVFVSHPKILSPKAVRYAFKNASVATLFNVEGFPASSFSTE